MSWPRFGLAVGALVLQVATAWSQVPPSIPAKISSVTARLYYSNSGTFSTNILDKPDLSLFNTIVGEGQSGGPSNATLVEVELDAGARSGTNNERLTITVQQKGKPPITRHPRLLFFERNGKHFEAVWLYDSGCRPVTITAQLGRQPAIRKRIDFDCGE